MKLAFVCGSLAPGRDGVGDYVMRLSSELIGRGHSVSVMALNDPAIRNVVDEQQADGDGVVSVLRVPSNWAWARRTAHARGWINGVGPDWISFQFVPFGFQRHGLAWKIEDRLSRIVGKRPVHLMFHEIWLRTVRTEPLRVRLWGALQRSLIVRMVRVLRPRSIHTSNAQYAKQLCAARIRAGILPVFSNIVVHERTGWLDGELMRLGITPANRKEWMLLGIFGEVHRQWVTADWLPFLTRCAAARQRRIGILGIGRVSRAGAEHFQREAASVRGLAVCQHLGMRPPAQVSDFLQSVDCGLPTVQRSLLGKSGSYAAMREHRLPVLITRLDDESNRGRATAQLRCAIETLFTGPRIGGAGYPEHGTVGSCASTLIDHWDQAEKVCSAMAD